MRNRGGAFIGSLLLLLAGCSSAPSRSPGIDPSVRAQAMKRAPTKSVSAKKSGLDLQCVVNLPGDVTSTNTDLCPNFPMYVTDASGNATARFRFPKNGRFRLPVPAGSVVMLQAEATDEWRMEFEPTGQYRAGMSVRVLFIRRP